VLSVHEASTLPLPAAFRMKGEVTGKDFYRIYFGSLARRRR
jgi:hypothetical protein